MDIQQMVVFLIGLFTTQVNCECPSISNVITMTDVVAAVHASEQIYEDTLVEGNKIPNTNFHVTKLYHEQILENGEGIRVIVADNGNTRMIVYRGTDGFEQLLAQGSSVIFGKEKEWTIGGVKTEVANFVYQAYRLSSYELRAFISDPLKKYILTGHSLGGALASILALESTQLFDGSVWKNPSSSLITFGQPRVGNRAYEEIHDRLISTYRKLRFVYKADPVIGIPLYIFGWRHHSRAVYMGTKLVYTGFGRKRNSIEKVEQSYEAYDGESENFTRSKRFLWKKQSYWQVCGTGDDLSCVNGITNVIPKITDHTIAKYRESVIQHPKHILTKNGSSKVSLQEALISTCEH